MTYQIISNFYQQLVIDLIYHYFRGQIVIHVLKKSPPFNAALSFNIVNFNIPFSECWTKQLKVFVDILNNGAHLQRRKRRASNGLKDIQIRSSFEEGKP